MKNLLLIPIAALTLSACQAAATDTAASKSQSSTPAAHTKVMATPIKAVRIYADWCPKCKVLDAQLKTLRAANDFENIEFIYLDFTKKDSEIFFAQAREFGIEEQVKAAFGGGRVRTGQMFLFDDETDALLKTITHTMSNEDLSKALTEQAS